MSFMSDNAKTFLKQMDAQEVEQEFLPRLKKGLESFLWRKGQDDPYPVQAKAAGEGVVEVIVDAGHRTIFRQSYVGQPVFLKFKVDAERQYFTSGVLKLDGDKFLVPLGAPFFVTTKRSTCRYLATNFDRIEMRVAGHLFQCHDISSGGFSAQVARAKLGGMEKGMLFEQGELKYALKRFTIPKLRLVALLDVPGRPDELKIAFQFEGMKTSDEDALWRAVNASIKKLADMTE
jgi:hypothetical protein